MLTCHNMWPLVVGIPLISELVILISNYGIVLRNAANERLF